MTASGSGIFYIVLMQYLELLAPAKNVETGMAAIDHGADAVYIGADRFGARQAASNSVDDIARLCEYAHKFMAHVYVTVNTIVFNSEIDDTVRMIEQLYEAGVDAILIQDMGLLERKLPPITLHASTQTDNRTVAKVKWLAGLGFKRVVLARELSYEEIKEIHREVPEVELEVFVHGALCVSYSGVCYASQHCFGRSANRGECAQFCRMKFDLVDADGKTIMHQAHLLSLKDMAQIDNLEALAEAGAVSFKIEGRLKDVEYVKNVTAAYSQRLDEIVSNNPNKYRRASLGHVRHNFTPNLNKTFNRGFTDYFFNGRQPEIASFFTPKAMGEYVGKVKDFVGRNAIRVAGTSAFANGDGLCFINAQRELQGFRINRAEGNHLYPSEIPAGLKRGTVLYRNNDMNFSKQLSGNSAERKIDVEILISASDNGYSLQMMAENGVKAVKHFEAERQRANKPQEENIRRQLSKLGNTVYSASSVNISNEVAGDFIPSSVLAEMRRTLVEAFDVALDNYRKSLNVKETYDGNANVKSANAPEYSRHGYLYNIANDSAQKFYSEHGLQSPVKAFEIKGGDGGPIMQCRHCIRYSLGYCVRRGGQKPTWKEPLTLVLGDGRRFRLEFYCAECQMNVYAED